MQKGQSSGNVFDEMGQLWAEIADKNQTQRQIDFLRGHLPRDVYVLDVASGTGRHMIPLTPTGFDIVGIDVSTHLLSIAKQRGAKQLVRGDIRFLPFKSGAFGAAVSMDTSFGYLPSEQEDKQSIAEIKRALMNGGQFVIDVFNREYLKNKHITNTSLPKWREYPNFSLLQERTITNNGEKLCDLWTIHGKDGQVMVFEHTVRLYKPQHLAKLLTETGFTVKAIYGNYEEQPYSSTTPRLIIRTSAN
jgi:SAM-dependent methyltransferase